MLLGSPMLFCGAEMKRVRSNGVSHFLKGPNYVTLVNPMGQDAAPCFFGLGGDLGCRKSSKCIPWDLLFWRVAKSLVRSRLPWCQEHIHSFWGPTACAGRVAYDGELQELV